ncbi:hypothetical protein ACM66B_001126 [Microbotryomycetes sp. NB124-2]
MDNVGLRQRPIRRDNNAAAQSGDDSPSSAPASTSRHPHNSNDVSGHSTGPRNKGHDINVSAEPETAEPQQTAPRRSSVHSIMSNDSKEDQDQVFEMLTGIRPNKVDVEGQARPTPTSGSGAGTATGQSAESDDKMCRICFLGPEEEPEMGRLFSPCKCSGTSRYVHVMCLDKWRSASANSSSFYQCDQCFYKYRFRRTRLATLVNSQLTLLAVTCILFTLIVYLSGFAANSVLAFAERRRASHSLFEDIFVSDHVILSEGVKDAVDLLGKQLENSKWVNPAVVDAQSRRRQLRAGPGNLNPTRSALQRKPPSWLFGLLVHFSKGFALVGLLSAFQSYVAATFISPFGRLAFRALRPRRGGGGGRGDDAAASMSQVVVVIFVVLGAVKAIVHLFRAVKWGSRRVLRRMSDLVLEA